MKKTKSSVLVLLAACSVLFSSCDPVAIDNPEPVPETSEPSRLKLRLTENGGTRSSISPDENLIQTICIMAYRAEDGMLADIQTCTSSDNLEMELPGGRYNLYVTANMGDFDAPAAEADLENAFHRINSFSNIDKALPMCWNGSVALKSGERTTVYASMSRLISKIGLRVEMGVLEGLEITSARLCNGAGILRPFMSGGSRIISKEEAIDGDYATSEDIALLMKGGTIYFYTTENCQGNLLPPDSTPWEKVPENIGDRSDICTYMEVEGKWNDNADYEGSITYRFYLGENAFSNFDIRRNSLHNLTLYLEEDNFDKISWKIDTSQMKHTTWGLTLDMSNNFHDKDNFYTTENICVEFSFDEKGKEYWKEQNNAFSLAGIDYNGNTIIRFYNCLDIGNGTFRAIGTCLKAGGYDLVMLNTQTGRIEYVMEHGFIHIPKIIVGEAGTYADNIVEGYDLEIDCWINGQPSDICIYLTDKNGYNLNQGHFWECEFSLCEWKIDVLSNKYGYSISDYVKIEPHDGEIERDSYVARYLLSFENDGRDESWNKILKEHRGGGTLTLSFEDLYSGARGVHPLWLLGDLY